MNNKYIISSLTDKIEEVQLHINNLKKMEFIHGIDVELILGKVRLIYDDLLKVKYSVDKELIQNVLTVENNISKTEIAEEVIEKVEKEAETTQQIVAEETLLKEEIIEKHEELIEETEEVVEEVKAETIKTEEEHKELIEKPEEEVKQIDTAPVVAEIENITEVKQEVIMEKEPVSETIETEKTPEPPVIKEEIKAETEAKAEVSEMKDREVTKETENKPEIIEKPEPVVVEKQEIKVEEPLFEMATDFKDETHKKPEVKQASLFGDEPVIKEKNKESKIKHAEKKESISDKLQTAKPSVNEILSGKIKETSLANQLQRKPITNIKSVISINDRIWFVKELFNNSNEKYNAVVDKINSLNSYNEAIDYLSDIFNLNDEKESLNKFLEIVQRRFLK